MYFFQPNCCLSITGLKLSEINHDMSFWDDTFLMLFIPKTPQTWGG